jgi:hypothetical protein
MVDVMRKAAADLACPLEKLEAKWEGKHDQRSGSGEGYRHRLRQVRHLRTEGIRLRADANRETP